jgi:hypothetical protein
MNTGNLDELTRIRGIGPARQRWFREALGVRTFRDLANLSADAIEARLRADNQIASRSTIESWLLQAGELAAESPAVEEPEEENPPVVVEDWKSLASFVIEFQMKENGEPRTIGHLLETDTTAIWPGFNGGHVCRWMLEAAHELLPASPPAPPPAPLAAEPPPPAIPQPTLAGASLHIAQLRLLQPPDSSQPLVISPAGELGGPIRADQPFALELSLDLAGVEGGLPAGAIPDSQARFSARDQATGVSIHLGDASARAGQPLAILLPEASLPFGSYRFYVQATLPGAVARPDFMESPMLTVV